MPPILYLGILSLLAHLTWSFRTATLEREDRWKVRALEDELLWVCTQEWSRIRTRPGFWSLRFSLRGLHDVLPQCSTWFFLVAFAALGGSKPGAWVQELELDEEGSLGIIYRQAKDIVLAHMRWSAPLAYGLARVWKGAKWLDDVATFVVENATPNAFPKDIGGPSGLHKRLARIAESCASTTETIAQAFRRADSFRLYPRGEDRLEDMKPIKFETLKINPTKIEALLPKLRRYADASLSVKQVFEVLAYLGGWSVTYEPALLSMDRHGDKEDFADENHDHAKRMHEKYAVPLDPATIVPVVDESYYGNATDIRTSEGYGGRVYYMFEYDHWRGVPSYVVRSPEGKVFRFMPQRYGGFELKDLRAYDLLGWLKTETDYLRQISNKLGLPTYAEEKENAKPRTRDNTGSCPCCLRNIKLHEVRGVGYTNPVKEMTEPHPAMVLHGYERPGHGSINGKCFGVDYPPYEISPAGTIAFRDQVILPRIAMNQNYLARLQAGEVDSINLGSLFHARVVSKGEAGWERAVKQKTAEVESELKGLERDRKTLQRLIDTWKVRPLPTEGSPIPDWEA